MENISQQLFQLLSRPELILPFIIWSIFWKGWALWKSASKRQLVWFIFLLMFNSLGLLEIAYIFCLNKWDLDSGKLLAFLEKKFPKSKKS